MGSVRREKDWDNMSWSTEDGRCSVALTYDEIDVAGMYARAKSPKAGAVVVFSGCTRDNSVPEGEYVEPAAAGGEIPQTNAHAHTIETTQALQQSTLEQTDLPQPQALSAASPNANSRHASPSSLPVASLTYTSYIPLALKTLQTLSQNILSKYRLERIAITHRLGTIPVGEESIVICVSAPHRLEAWRAGETALEEVKKKVEIWKWEVFRGAGDDEVDGEAIWRSNVRDAQIRSQQVTESRPI